jgi:hypothetical protein
MMSYGVLYGDDAAFRLAVTHFAHALHTMRSDGSLPYEIERDACGLQYQNHAIASMVYIASLADRQQIDLFNLEINGRSLGKAIEFLLDATKDPRIADKYRVAGTVCNYPTGAPQVTDLYTLPSVTHGVTTTYSAWTEIFLRRFPNHPRRIDLMTLLKGGAEAFRPLQHAVVGGISSCNHGSTFDPAVEDLFDKAELRYPQLFTRPGSPTEASSGFQYRYYPTARSYLGVRNSEVYFIAPEYGPSPVYVGPLNAVLSHLQ